MLGSLKRWLHASRLKIRSVVEHNRLPVISMCTGWVLGGLGSAILLGQVRWSIGFGIKMFTYVAATIAAVVNFIAYRRGRVTVRKVVTRIMEKVDLFYDENGFNIAKYDEVTERTMREQGILGPEDEYLSIFDDSLFEEPTKDE